MLNKKTQKKVFYCKKKIITYLKLCAYAQQELKLKKNMGRRYCIYAFNFKNLSQSFSFNKNYSKSNRKLLF